MSNTAVSLHDGNMARQLVNADAPEGVLLATAWKRGSAYVLDVIFIMGVLTLATGGNFLIWTWSISALLAEPHVVLFHWIFLITCHWLYFKYTGLWLGRSLGQRWFSIALVHHDASPLGRAHWGRRALAKTRYAIPLVGPLLFGLMDMARIRSDEQHRSNIDEKHGTVAAVDWSLPPATRSMLR